jgi:hypothetical protein
VFDCSSYKNCPTTIVKTANDSHENPEKHPFFVGFQLAEFALPVGQFCSAIGVPFRQNRTDSGPDRQILPKRGRKHTAPGGIEESPVFERQKSTAADQNDHVT